uniref:Uncharacterized protein n=2 Tax=viral metagenome TaxID=1070528 RepID=A0A6M3JWX4_9ZZZZ
MATGRGTRGRESLFFDFHKKPVELGYRHCPGHHDPVKITKGKECEYCGKLVKEEYCTCEGRFSFSNRE